MDEIDVTTERMEAELARRLAEERAKAPVSIEGPGWCLSCEAPLDPDPLTDITPRWCGAGCRDAWQRQQDAIRRNYGAGG